MHARIEELEVQACAPRWSWPSAWRRCAAPSARSSSPPGWRTDIVRAADVRRPRPVSRRMTRWLLTAPPVRHAPAWPGGGAEPAGALRARPHRDRRAGQARPGDRPRRGDSPRDPGALAAHQEQSRPDRRARSRQDRDRRGSRPADRLQRRARVAARPPRDRAGHGRPDRGRRLPGRVRGTPQGRPQRGRQTRRGRSSCSSTSCTRSSAPAPPRARSTPPTCSSRCSPAANCAPSARPRSTSTPSTSRRTPRWSAAFSR